MGSVSEEILVLQIRAAVKVFLEVRSSNAALWEENAVGQICLSLPPLPTIEQYVALLNIIRRVFQQVMCSFVNYFQTLVTSLRGQIGY